MKYSSCLAIASILFMSALSPELRATSSFLKIVQSHVETEATISFETEDGTKIHQQESASGSSLSTPSSYLLENYEPTWDNGTYRVFSAGHIESYFQDNYLDCELRSDAESDEYGDSPAQFFNVVSAAATATVFVDLTFIPTVTNAFLDTFFVDTRSSNHASYFSLTNLTTGQLIFYSEETEWSDPNYRLTKGNRYNISAYTFDDVLEQDDESEVYFRLMRIGGESKVPDSGSPLLLAGLALSLCFALRPLLKLK